MIKGGKVSEAEGSTFTKALWYQGGMCKKKWLESRRGELGEKAGTSPIPSLGDPDKKFAFILRKMESPQKF